MKKLFIFAFALFSLNACIVKDADTPSEYRLTSYATDRMFRFVGGPLYALEHLLLASEYEEASEEEKQDRKYDYIRELLLHVDGNTLQVDGVGTFRLDGFILVQGSSCTCELYGSAVYGNALITNVGDGWQYSYESQEESLSAVFSRTEAGDAWLVEMEAEVVEADLTARFNTAGESLKVMKTDEENLMENEFYGKFYMDIYLGGTKTDFCYLTYNGPELTVQASR